MRQLTFAFYRARGTWLSGLIRGYTGSIYSHVEVQIPELGNFSTSLSWAERFRVRAEWFPLPPAAWDCVYVPVDDELLRKIRRYARSLIGAKYDWLGILGAQVLPLGLDDERRHYCSELACKIAQLAGVEDTFQLQPHRTDPGDLALCMFGAGYKERR